LPTLSEAITEGAARLEHSAIAEARRTAGVLLCHVLGIERTHLLTRSDESISEANYETFLRLVDRRAAGEPLQYITGHQEFYGLDFIVTPDVLIPRPETEFLVERVLKRIQESKQASPLIVDVGTGSGCIAVSVSVHAPLARMLATDASQCALDIAMKNAVKHGVRDRIEFLPGDLLAPLAGRDLDGAIDILASNPPYVNARSVDQLQPEVRDWEPHAALLGGPEGLDFYRRLFEDATGYLKPDGFIVIEIGYDQFDAIEKLSAVYSWEIVEVTRDLQGIPRTLTLKNMSENTSALRLSR
jgi:release factor glutamine methyltransferase